MSDEWGEVWSQLNTIIGKAFDTGWTREEIDNLIDELDPEIVRPVKHGSPKPKKLK